MIARSANEVTAANAGGGRLFPTREPWAARIAQFCRLGKPQA
jgi:hypothetical protein